MAKTHLSLSKCVCNKFNVGTLNIRGCKDPYDRSILAKDALRYDLQILGVQETHLKHQNNQGFENIVALLDSPKRSRTYNFFYCGSDKNTHQGVGLLINSALNQTFNRISDRICSAKIQLKSRCLSLDMWICSYAHKKWRESQTQRRFLRWTGSSGKQHQS